MNIDILTACMWKHHITFTSFYLRDLTDIEDMHIQQITAEFRSVTHKNYKVLVIVPNRLSRCERLVFPEQSSRLLLGPLVTYMEA